MPTRLASDDQVRLIEILRQEIADGEELVEDILEDAGVQRVDELSVQEASALIDDLKALQR